jgi:hypothetical protein
MGAWTEIVDFTFTANETSRAFSGLNITKDDFIKIVTNISNGTGSTITIRLFPDTAAGVTNNDTTTNYRSQQLKGAGGSVSSQATNANIFARVDASEKATNIGYFKIDVNNRAITLSNGTIEDTSTLETSYDYCVSSGLTFTDAITELEFSASATDGLGTGSRIQIYRLDAIEVADVTVASNTTQVDIPVTGSLDPAISKGSEYLLVGDITASNDFLNLNLAVNDATTLTNYYSQRIGAEGTSNFANRFNLATVLETNVSNKGLFYCFIKLSNIGAHTFQSYSLRNNNTTSPVLTNFFGSSTSEAITSITKLNLRSSDANRIGAGSRFQLFKLFE